MSRIAQLRDLLTRSNAATLRRVWIARAVRALQDAADSRRDEDPLLAVQMVERAEAYRRMALATPREA